MSRRSAVSPTPVLILSLFGFAAIGAFVVWRARGFAKRVHDLEEQVGNEVTRLPRTDLPAEIAALARRLGAEAGLGPARLRQEGHMWSAPGRRPMVFKARQISATTKAEFIWHAHAGPGHLIEVIDSYVGDVGGLEVRSLKALTLARMIGGADMAKGEALRYLAELPINPDAILMNGSLEWSVTNPGEFVVSTRAGDSAESVAVTFQLDAEGLPQTVFAAARPYLEAGQTRSLPWKGRYWDYARFHGRLMPRQAEVAWVMDDGEFIYWRGSMQSWAS